MSSGQHGPVAIVGLGLMGGSLARALRAADGTGEILGIDPDPLTGTRALDEGVVDRYDPEGDAFIGDARTIVYAAPLRTVVGLLGDHVRRIHSEALVTDVVSLKTPILGRAREVGLSSRLVGAHPLAGSERSGFGGSNARLYEGARLYLCADESVEAPLRERAERFWGGVGACPEWIDAAEHDRVMAWVSHLPQLVSNALAGALDAAGIRPEQMGPGARDMTRLAGSSPEMWKDLLAMSAPLTGTGLTSVSRALQVLGDLLARRDIDRIVEFMDRTRAWQGGEASAD